MSLTPSLISKRFKTTLTFLLALLISIATVLLPASSPLYAQGNSNRSTGHVSPRPGDQIITMTYIVVRGDTLAAIAKRFNTTVFALLRLNPQIHNPNRLFVGQRIQVPAPANQSSGFTFTRFYLIALNNGGSIGCGDSLVPVTVEIPATHGILRASLEKLLALRTQFYGESGLYNALYQSNLTIDDVRIDNRIATIRLSGQIVLGGACDSPRVQAQLEQAARQYSTVDQVKIYINGTPLQDVLSEK